MASVDSLHSSSVPLVVPARAGGLRFDELVPALVPGLSRRRARVAITSGEILLDGAPLRVCSRQLEPGRLLAIPAALAAGIDLPELPLLTESVAYAAFAKPPGMLSEPSVSTDARGAIATGLELARRAFALRGARPAFAACVGRLDRPVSGLLLVAKSGENHGRLVRALGRDDAEKIYWAICDGAPEPDFGSVTLPIRRAGVVHFEARAGADDAKAARTDFRVLSRSQDASLIEVRLLTGRTHQARLHLAAIGAPVAGDTRYGRPGPNGERDPETPTPRVFLHATRLTFRWQDRMEAIECPPPEDFRVEMERRELASI